VLVRTIVVKAIFLATIALSASDDFAEAAARRISSLPKTMIGAWGDDAQSCGILNDIGRVIVKAGSVDFFASSHTVKSITTRPDRTIHAVTEASEEGEEGILRSTLDLKLHSPDRLSFAIDGTNVSTKIRCKMTAESYSKAIEPIIPHRKIGDEVCFSGPSAAKPSIWRIGQIQQRNSFPIFLWEASLRPDRFPLHYQSRTSRASIFTCGITQERKIAHSIWHLSSGPIQKA